MVSIYDVQILIVRGQRLIMNKLKIKWDANWRARRIAFRPMQLNLHQSNANWRARRITFCLSTVVDGMQKFCVEVHFQELQTRDRLKKISLIIDGDCSFV